MNSKTAIAAFVLIGSLAGSALAAEKTESLMVGGWHCGGCAAKTESALRDVNGVRTVSADKVKKQVTVTYDDSKAKRADLEKAIAEAGFSVEK
jgi:copper chaperone CopZ